MIKFYKTIDGVFREIEHYEPGCWINSIDPSAEDISEIYNVSSADVDFLKAALDEEETSRIENEGDQTLIIVDVPLAQKEKDGVIYSTLPMGIITTKDCLITVSLKESSVIKEFTEGCVKNIDPNLKTRFILQLLYRVAVRYLQYLKQIDKISSFVERQLHRSMKNKELIQLLDLEKSLVFFSTSLKANEVTLEKILRGKFIKLYEEDQDLLEDVLIEVKQAIEMSNIYSNILSGTMDAFASVISNNLNIVMKVLTSITILMAIPTMISSFWGMNVSNLPVANFWIVAAIAGAVTAVCAFFLNKKNML